MAIVGSIAPRIRGIVTCVPPTIVDNLAPDQPGGPEANERFVAATGIRRRHVVAGDESLLDLCAAAASTLLASLGWAPGTIDALVLISETSSGRMVPHSCLLQSRLGLPNSCAAFDVGLACSGYPYALWIASSLIRAPGIRRVLLVHGDTTSRLVDPDDPSTSLLFGDAGSATALEWDPAAGDRTWHFSLHTDGSGAPHLCVAPAGGPRTDAAGAGVERLRMNGTAIFSFALTRLPPLIEETLKAAAVDRSEVDYFVLHQSNQLVLREIARKCGIPGDRMPTTLADFGNTSGTSIPLTVTMGGLARTRKRPLKILLAGYGAGYSWGSALVDLEPDAVLEHLTLQHVSTPP